MFAGFGGGGKGKSNSAGDTALRLSQSEKNDGKDDDGGQSVHGFDPRGLERAAKAAKELDTSKNAKEALRLISQQEVTKQKENEMERARFQAAQQELAIKRAHEEAEAAQRTLEKQTQHEKQRAEYKDQLERKRMVEQINAQRRIQEEEREKAEASLRRQEEIRRKTLEYEAELRQQTEMARVKAETEGKILQERSNADVVRERDRNKAREFRETVLESIKLAGTTIGQGVSEFVRDEKKMTATALTITGIMFGMYTARETTRVLGRYAQARLGKPSLVRDTSKKNIIGRATSAVVQPLKNAFSGGAPPGALASIVLEPSLAGRLERVSVSTRNTKTNRAPFRNLLLHGPPGTGKTMFAKGLAQESGLDYAIMTGGDVAPLGKDAVTEIHNIFDWANVSSKGVLLFVDEADAFLRKRSGAEGISENMRNALNAFLYRTGEASTKIMVVMASNQPDHFDWAINDRIDEMVEFKLPGFEERLRMISHYMDLYITNPPTVGSRRITASDDINEATLRSVAMNTEGFSGREIAKLGIAWQAAAYGTVDAKLDVALLNAVLKEAKDSKRAKKGWLSAEEVNLLTSDSS